MMKNKILFLIAFLSVQWIACTKDDATPSAVPVTASSLAGDFTVSSFVRAGDQTSTFSGYVFTFTENGSLTATKGNDAITGTWRLDDSDDTELKINFSAAPFSEMNQSWRIAEFTTARLLLTDDDDNGGDSNDDNPKSGDRLQFERK